jgi:ATP-dependent DNA helicase
MGSHTLNSFANKWSTSPGKKEQQLAVDAEMSGVTTPVTMTESELSARQESSPPTSPATGSASSVQQDVKMVGTDEEKIDATPDIVGGDVEDEDEDDTEGMDMKAKALTKLLQTSSVS